MIRRTLRISFVVVLAASLMASLTTPASAHANLVKCNIKNHEVFRVGHMPHRIVGHFAEELDPARSWMQVFEGVADHGLVTEHQKSKVSFKHPKVITVKLPKLHPLKYYLIWYTHSLQDGHYAAGVVYFRVKR